MFEDEHENQLFVSIRENTLVLDLFLTWRFSCEHVNSFAETSVDIERWRC